MYHAADNPDRVGLLNAMSMIGGRGEKLACPSVDTIQRQLGISDESLTFLRYHGANDGDPLGMFHRARALAVRSHGLAADVVRHAQVTALLYRLHFGGLDHV